MNASFKNKPIFRIYSSGADFDAPGSRITDPHVLNGFRVRVRIPLGFKTLDLLSNEEVELSNLSFDRLVGFEEGYYIDIPLFEYALLVDDNLKTERIFLLTDIEFYLEDLITHCNIQWLFVFHETIR